ncbi:hypothetical protein [Spiroplasma endosymbiont of Labia minor]|uniref:hypothetical protein n=1 Tax=Spiroplasma endosymbiont of Labia minor TaxID=3066305 RepID=UPI0030CCBFE1
MKLANKNVDISWFETTNLTAGDKTTPGSVDVLAATAQNKEFLNISKASIQTIIKESETIDTSVGNGTGIIEGISSITELSNKTIFASSIKKINILTDEGRIFSDVENDITSVSFTIQLSNETILATSADNAANKIWKLNVDGTINSIINNESNTGISSITQLKNGTILVGTNFGLIYQLTDEGKIDTSVGNGTGILEDKTFDGFVRAITELSNGTILVGTGTTNGGSIYKLVN